MVWPTLISVSLTPGPYCFCASAGDANSASVTLAKIIPRTDIRLPPRFFTYGGSVGEQPRICKRELNRGGDYAALPSDHSRSPLPHGEKERAAVAAAH